jgi:Short C-terminal domain
MKAEHATPAAPASGDTPDVTDQIRKFGQLRDQGLLTDEEFATKKADLLARL